MDKSPTQTIIEDSIKGGWEYRGIRKDNFKKVGRGSMDDDFELHSIYNSYLIPIERVLLDQKFWEAVGVTRGWKVIETMGIEIGGWKDRQLDFTKRLQEGLSIDEALKILE